VLYEPAADVLASFSAHEGAVSAWFTVLALSAALLAPIAIGVGRLSSDARMRIAVRVGIAAAAVQVIGLARWPILVPGYAAEAWYGLYAPAKTPPDIIDRLNKSAAKAVQSEAFKRLGANEGLVMVAEPPDALDRYFSREEERWRKVIEDAGIKIE